MKVGVHVVFLLGQKPGEIAAVVAEQVETQRVDPAEQFLLGAFAQDGHLVVEESEITLLAHGASGEDVAADYADSLAVAAEMRREHAHGGAGEDFHVVGLYRGGAGHCDLAAHAVVALGEEMADGGQALHGNCPYCVTLHYGADMADLHAYVAGGVLALEYMEGGILETGERGGCAVLCVQRDVDAAGCELREGVDALLEIGHPVAEGELGGCCQGSGAEG